MDEELIAETLEAMSDGRTAKAMGRSIRTLKGVRGVKDGEVARIAAALWHEEEVDLEHDDRALSRLFAGAYEDGLVAIGLLAAALPDDPEAAWDLGTDWLGRLDDTSTADALGWLVLGPSMLAAGRTVDDLLERTQSHEHPAVRRAGVAAALAFLPVPVEGAAAAPLRERVGMKRVQFVEQPLTEGLVAVASATARDEDATVRKGLRRLLRLWTKVDPASVAAWGQDFPGGLHKMLGAEVKRAARRAAKAPR